MKRELLKHERQAYTNVLVIAGAMAGIILAGLVDAYEGLGGVPWWAWVSMALPLGLAATATFNRFFPADHEGDGPR